MKNTERVPHMSAGPSSRFDDGTDDNILWAIGKSIWWALSTATKGTAEYLGKKVKDMRSSGDWSWKNGIDNAKTGASYVWTGATYVYGGAAYLVHALISVKDNVASWKVY